MQDPPHSPELSYAAFRVRQTLRQHDDATVLVDFDETLLLANSTELYLRSARPRAIAHAISKLVSVSRPWRVFGVESGRFVWLDWLRVLLTTILLPWTLPLWRYHHAPRIAKRFANRELIAALSEERDGKFTVVSHGFSPIIGPILRRIAPKAGFLGASFFGGPSIRLENKARAVERRFGPEALDGAIFISDGADDGPLLQRVARPLTLRWPGTETGSAFHDTYLPFLYTLKCKRPQQNYVLSGVLGWDVAFIVLAFGWLMPNVVLGGIGLMLMHCGLWCVYELGYVENDRIAVDEEADGTLRGDFAAYAERVDPRAAWAWSFCLSAAGLALVSLAGAGTPTIGGVAALLALWMAYLGGLRLAFHVYNITVPDRRYVQYGVLQAMRYAGYALLFATNAIGAALIAALIVGRWVPYLVYRLGGRRWTEGIKLIILAMFLFMLPFALTIEGVGPVIFQLGAALAWLAFRTRREFVRHVADWRDVRRSP